MRAVVHDRYGPPEVLRLDEVERPVPGDDEVLVRVHATTVTQTDCHMRRARPLCLAFHARAPEAEEPGPRRGARGRGRGRGLGGHRVRPRRPGVRDARGRSRRARLRPGGGRARSHPGGHVVRRRGRGVRRGVPGHGAPSRRRRGRGHAPPRVRRLRIVRHGGRADRQAPRRARHGRVRHEEPRARPLARCRRGDRLHAGGLHEERSGPTT